MSVRVNFEIGHASSIRTKATPEGFTHDWEVFVRGSDTHDIGHFVDKVVFYLHETFPKPRRVVKEPPFSVKESGYAGFVIPIEVYLKNKDEPKRIKFAYDLALQQTGPDTYNLMNEQYVFHTPNEEFKKKLLKGGGFITNHSSYAGQEQERNSRDSFSDEKSQLISKPKLSGDAAKKHKPKEHRYELPRPSNSFVNLFGAPIQKPSKVSPDPKKMAPTLPPPPKPDKKDKEKLTSEKEKQKSKHEHKEKEKKKEEKDKAKEDKARSHKDIDKAKEKSGKRPSERTPSPAPTPAKKKCLSPPRRNASPPAKSSSSAGKDDPKTVKTTEPEKKTTKEPLEAKIDKEKKSRKEKKSHDKDKERASKKDQKKEEHRWGKEAPKETAKEVAKPKEMDVRKEREAPVEPLPPPPPPPPKEKPVKPEKPFNKFSIENLVKKPEMAPKDPEEPKSKEKGDSERRHKHKKKDKKRDESRERHKESKKHKHNKPAKEPPPPPKEHPPPEPETIVVEDDGDDKAKQDPGSPSSIDTSSQGDTSSHGDTTSQGDTSSKSSKISKLLAIDVISASSDSDSDSGPDDDRSGKTAPKTKPPSRPPDPPKPVEVKTEPAAPPPPPLAADDKAAGPSHKDKSKKHKDKSKHSEGEEKNRRKRKSTVKEEGPEVKMVKTETTVKREGGAAGGSRANRSDTKLQDNGVSSSLGEDDVDEPDEAEAESGRRDAAIDSGDISPDYMLRLKDLQQRIMTIKSNEELERVVNLIAETGRYEVSTHTFDFDLCMLDRSTVQQLIALIG